MLDSQQGVEEIGQVKAMGSRLINTAFPGLIGVMRVSGLRICAALQTLYLYHAIVWPECVMEIHSWVSK